MSGVTIVLTPNGLFETICDSIGIALSSGAYVIEIQADMLIDEVSFDSTMVEVLEAVPSLFLLSGRGAHSLDYPGRRSTRAMLLGKSRSLAYLAYRAVHRRRGWYAASAWELALSNSVGRVGNLIELPAVSLERRWVYLHETVMRGPLAFEKARYEALGGLDADHFFLGDDDHDLAARAWGERSWRSGYTSISFSSPLDAGSTRALRSIVQQSRFDFLNDFYKNAERESYRALRGSNLPKAPRQRIEIL
ncbi:hypothetical protein [Cryobacterium sp. GrIS_2_6]|uniref:hypothetical protein n=1 Tax=Cryobacterium sp. GrIS_2_6 TaxID=3162785 RepID=UPI002E078AE4|nr:hypothetical protein [Cryobacterium psychrotolerans]